MNLNGVPLIVLGSFNFHFPIDFIGGQKGGQLTGGQCFVETQINQCCPLFNDTYHGTQVYKCTHDNKWPSKHLLDGVTHIHNFNNNGH